MAEPFRIFTTKVVPIDAENVDTDQIIPARYLKVTDKVGLADALFRDWRFEEDGSLKDPPFILDQPGMAGRGILLVGDNFGSGSSREHAPWALTSWGVRAILSTGFADIFRSNSLKNGLLPIAVPPEVHRRLRDLIERDPEAELTVDLAEQGVLLPDGSTIDFEIDPFAKRMLLAGTDELGYLLSKERDIAAWESKHPPRIETRVTTWDGWPWGSSRVCIPGCVVRLCRIPGPSRRPACAISSGRAATRADAVLPNVHQVHVGPDREPISCAMTHGHAAAAISHAGGLIVMHRYASRAAWQPALRCRRCT